MRSAILASWLALLGASAPTVARADHLVRVRAETRIELDVRRGETSLEIHGVLRDDVGAALRDAPVRVTVRPEHGAVIASESMRTREAGDFEARLPATPGTAVVDATYLGDTDLEASSVRIVVDEQRAHVVLFVSLDGGSRLSLDAPSHHVRIDAESALGGAGLHVEIRNEIGREIAAGTTDERGRFEAEMASALLGPPAAGRLIARSEADETRASAQTEVPIVRMRETRIEWLDATSEISEGTVLRGRLATSSGPLERRAVGLFVGDEHVGTRLTGPFGEIAFPLEPSAARGADSARVVARFESDAPWLGSSESPPRTLGARSRPRVVPALAALSALAFAAVALWLRRRPAEPDPTSRESRAPGVTASRPMTLRPTIREVSGRVLRAATSAPLPNGAIVIGGATHAVRADGSFDLPLPDGTHLVTFDAEGFEPIERRVVVPHRGEWRGVAVRLESRRDLTSRALLEILALAVPGDVAGTATDRELLAIAKRSARGHAPVAALVAEVEPIVYGQTPPTPAAVARVRALADEARRALTRVDSSSPGSL